MASSTQVIHAYRSLYRNLLKAVQHTIPARFVVRDQLRSAFREKGASFDETGIKRTVWFLEAASKERGLEHKILKNLIAVQRKRYPRDNKQFKKALKPAGLVSLFCWCLLEVALN